MRLLQETIEAGFPDHKDNVPHQIREYHKFRNFLSTVDGVVTYKERIVIPPSLRSDVFKPLHSAHQCINSMTARADISVFWPCITPQIEMMRTRCKDCNRMAPSQPNAPPTQPQQPVYTFQYICSDYFHYKGAHYLITV